MLDLDDIAKLKMLHTNAAPRKLSSRVQGVTSKSKFQSGRDIQRHLGHGQRRSPRLTLTITPNYISVLRLRIERSTPNPRFPQALLALDPLGIKREAQDVIDLIVLAVARKSAA